MQKTIEDTQILVGPHYIKISDPPKIGNYKPSYLVIAWPKEGNQVGLLVRREP